MGSSPTTTPFYGMAVFEAESYDKIFQVFADPEYQRVVFPDEQKLLDRGRSQLFAGQVATVWEKARAPEVRPLLPGSARSPCSQELLQAGRL